jgi:hypothetical protein
MYLLLGELLRGRKELLFGVACCRRVEHLLRDRRGAEAMAAAEQYAEGLTGPEYLRSVSAEIHQVAWTEVTQQRDVARSNGATFQDIALGRHDDELNVRVRHAATAFFFLAADDLPKRALAVTFQCQKAGATPTPGAPNLWAVHEENVQCALLRDIFGNPFRPVSFSPSWRTDTVVALARQMYEAQDFSAMPILADALQDAGCDNEDVLGHCRERDPTHVRGCWVVDLVLGKE